MGIIIRESNSRMMLKQFLTLFALIAVVTADILPCTSDKGALPKAVTIENCENLDDQCDFVRGKEFKADVTFKARKNICKWFIETLS